MKITDSEGNEHETTLIDFDLDKLREQGLFPEDYELCGTCEIGDHDYDFPLAGAENQWKSLKSHLKTGDEFDINVLCNYIEQIKQIREAAEFLNNLKKYDVLTAIAKLD